eukprot:gene5350-5663_t
MEVKEDVKEVKEDVRRVFNTGWFKECVPDAIDTRDGVKLIIKSDAEGTARVVQKALRGSYGKSLNFVTFKESINKLDSWYRSKGILGQVTDFDLRDGIVYIDLAEAVVGRIDLRFIDGKTLETKEKPSTKTE